MYILCNVTWSQKFCNSFKHKSLYNSSTMNPSIQSCILIQLKNLDLSLGPSFYVCASYLAACKDGIVRGFQSSSGAYIPAVSLMQSLFLPHQKFCCDQETPFLLLKRQNPWVSDDWAITPCSQSNEPSSQWSQMNTFLHLSLVMGMFRLSDWGGEICFNSCTTQSKPACLWGKNCNG